MDRNTVRRALSPVVAAMVVLAVLLGSASDVSAVKIVVSALLAGVIVFGLNYLLESNPWNRS